MNTVASPSSSSSFSMMSCLKFPLALTLTLVTSISFYRGESEAFSRHPVLSRTSSRPYNGMEYRCRHFRDWKSGCDLKPHFRMGKGKSRNQAGEGFVLRASFMSYDQLMETIPSGEVIKAVESSPTGNVIASDVAAGAGVSLSRARKELTALASLTRGDIAVSSEGELIYSFPVENGGIRGVLSQNSARYRALRTWKETVWPALFYAIRLSFGVALVASIAVLAATVFFIAAGGASSDDDRDDRPRGGGGGGMRMGGGGFMNYGWWGPSPFDVFYYRPYYGRTYLDYRNADEDEMGFFESTFSYLFGDGDPNRGVEETMLKMAASTIRANGGAVVAEQLAPFVIGEDGPPSVKSDDDDSIVVDETFVLPLVTQLGGEPKVTEDGNIVYIFPEIMQTATSSSAGNAKADREKKERSLLKRVGLPRQTSNKKLKEYLEWLGTPDRAFLPGMERYELMELLEQRIGKQPYDDDDDMTGFGSASLQENEYRFSLAPDSKKFLAGGLGVLNIGLVAVAGQYLSPYTAVGATLPGIYGVVQGGFPLLLGYAILFNALPLGRSLWLRTANAKIRERNRKRREWDTKVRVLSSSAGRLGRKLKEAKNMAMTMKQLGGKDDVVYDTRQTTEDLGRARADDDLQDFDRLLKEDET